MIFSLKEQIVFHYHIAALLQMQCGRLPCGLQNSSNTCSSQALLSKDSMPCCSQIIMHLSLAASLVSQLQCNSFHLFITVSQMQFSIRCYAADPRKIFGRLGSMVPDLLTVIKTKSFFQHQMFHISMCHSCSETHPRANKSLKSGMRDTVKRATEQEYLHMTSKCLIYLERETLPSMQTHLALGSGFSNKISPHLSTIKQDI